MSGGEMEAQRVFLFGNGYCGQHGLGIREPVDVQGYTHGSKGGCVSIMIHPGEGAAEWKWGGVWICNEPAV